MSLVKLLNERCSHTAILYRQPVQDTARIESCASEVRRGSNIGVLSVAVDIIALVWQISQNR